MITTDCTLFKQVNRYIRAHSARTYTDAEIFDAMVHVLEHPPVALVERTDIWTWVELNKRAEKRSIEATDELRRRLLDKVKQL